MKCQHCGANLAIEDEVCSFCGEQNPFAQKHRQQMHMYAKDFKQTKSKVLKESRTHSRWVTKITLIAVMAAANLLIWFCISNSYEISDFVAARKAEANYTQHKKILDEYEQNRQFIAFSSYYNENRLYHSSKFREYQALENVCAQYGYIYSYLMEIVTQDETEYYPHEQRLESITQQLDYLYRYSKPQTYDDMTQFSQVHQEAMDAAVTQVEDMIQTYFAVSDEDIAGFADMSSARRQIIMEEGLMLYE